jgi:hypothetical protein
MQVKITEFSSRVRRLTHIANFNNYIALSRYSKDNESKIQLANSH